MGTNEANKILTYFNIKYKTNNIELKGCTSGISYSIHITLILGIKYSNENMFYIRY